MAQRTLSTYPIKAKLRNGIRVTIRPIEPEDAQREQAFVRGLSQESRYFRFMNTLRELSPQMLERFTHPDAAREIALVALTGEGVSAQQIGVARCALMQDGTASEFALVVADSFQGQGLGGLLMQALLNAADERGIKRIEGLVLNNNQRMLELMHALGFEASSAPEDPSLRRVVKQLSH
jgi:acetyltransferase